MVFFLSLIKKLLILVTRSELSGNSTNVTFDRVLPENPESIKETSNVSYWENTFKAFGLNFPTKLLKHKHTDTYWRKIGSIKDDSGHVK